MTKISVSIGIPALNEERNIKGLISSLLSQKTENFVLRKILVISDGSTDNTAKLVRELKSSKVQIIESKKRMGKSHRLTQLFKLLNKEFIFLIDADITISDPKLLSKIFQAISPEKVGLVAVNTIPLEAENFFERAINFSVKIQMDIRKNWNKGNNYLAFNGRFLGLHKNLTKISQINDGLVNHDAYLYFKALEKGFEPKYFPNLKVYYRSPQCFSDHLKQSMRYKASKEELRKYFENNEKFGYLSFRSRIGLAAKYFFNNPIMTISYLIINFISEVIGKKKVNPFWEIAQSTKD